MANTYRASLASDVYDSPSRSEQTDYDNEKGSAPRTVGYKGKDDPFGDESNAEVKYRTMHWWQAGMIMIAETISLGILSLPSVLASVGMVPYVFLQLSSRLPKLPGATILKTALMSCVLIQRHHPHSRSRCDSHLHRLRDRPVQARLSSRPQHGRCGRGDARCLRP